MDEHTSSDQEATRSSDPISTEKAELVWEDPPPVNLVSVRVWEPRLHPVMLQPGKWARVLECKGLRRAETHVSNLRSGKVVVPPGVWEFASRSNKQDQKSWVYARYCGPEEPAANPPGFDAEFRSGETPDSPSDAEYQPLREEVSG